MAANWNSSSDHRRRFTGCITALQIEFSLEKSFLLVGFFFARHRPQTFLLAYYSHPGYRPKQFSARTLRQCGIEALQSCPQVAHEHNLALISAAQFAGGIERFVIVGLYTLSAERLAQVFGERLLNQPVFAVESVIIATYATAFAISATILNARSSSNSAKSCSRKTGLN